MMHTRNEQSQIKARSTGGSCEAAVFSAEPPIDCVTAERLKSRFGFAPELARVLAELMAQHGGLASQEVRCG